MNYQEIAGEFINDLQGILNTTASQLDRDTVDDIKASAHEALCKILIKYKLIEP